jgi:hypothetical protein
MSNNVIDLALASSSSNKKRKYEEVASVLETTIPVSLLECVACTEMITDDFVQASCLHRMCKMCWTKCESKCPVCRCVDPKARPDPLALALLAVYPRQVRCGLIMCGNEVRGHEEACIPCWRVLLEQKEAELECHRKSLETYQTKNESLQTRVNVLELAMQSAGSGSSSGPSPGLLARMMMPAPVARPVQEYPEDSGLVPAPLAGRVDSPERRVRVRRPEMRAPSISHRSAWERSRPSLRVMRASREEEEESTTEDESDGEDAQRQE